MRNKITAALLLFTVFLGLAACAKAPPDYVGLYYYEGSSDGYHFGHCFEPGAWALAGRGDPSGIMCMAARGPMVQSVILLSNDPEALRKRLQAAGYANW